MHDWDRIKCVIMRGGTSKAVFFHENDLPSDEIERDKVILKAFGSPDIRQINGLGGANSSTSKVAIIGVSKRTDVDIDYTFGQVSLDLALIGKEMNCGNISSAVGPFAIDEGLIKAEEPITVVRIFNTNTNKVIVAHVPVKDGRALTKGNYEIQGVPGTGSRIDLEFEDPGGAVTKKVLPTGIAKQMIKVEGEKYNISIVDAANPVVFIQADELGLRGTELPWEVEKRPDGKKIMDLVEKIRGTAAELIGMVSDGSKSATLCPTLPKIGFYTKPIDYVDAAGRTIKSDQIDIVGRLFSMGKIIHAYMGTGAVCTITAANIAGTVVNEIVKSSFNSDGVTNLRIGHPFGIMPVKAKLVNKDGQIQVKSATISRTARRIMEGWVYIQR